MLLLRLDFLYLFDGLYSIFTKGVMVPVNTTVDITMMLYDC